MVKISYPDKTDELCEFGDKSEVSDVGVEEATGFNYKTNLH